MNKNKLTPKFGRYLSYTISNDKSLLDMLDSVEEFKDIKDKDIKSFNNKNTCKCCNKVILNNFIEEHQVKCFKNKIENLSIQLKLKEEDVRHESRIKTLEFMIKRNDEKWKNLYNS